MSVRDIQRDSVIPNETGIITRKLNRYCAPSPFAVQNLFYAMLGSGIYLRQQLSGAEEKELKSWPLFYLMSGGNGTEVPGKNLYRRADDVFFLVFPILMPTKP